jgi:hypothetical protein
VLAPVAITSTFRLIRSVTSSEYRSWRPSAHRYKSLRCGPNVTQFIQIVPECRQMRNRRSWRACGMNPTTGIVRCCARAETGHAAAPPRSG